MPLSSLGAGEVEARYREPPCFCAGCVATRDAAELKSLALLRQWLSPDQLAQFEANRSFDVTGCKTGKRYRIAYGTQMNIAELDQQGGHIRHWCFQPNGVNSAGDVMLAQKIALETYETKALKVANSSPRARAGIPSLIASSYGIQALAATLVVGSICVGAWAFAQGSYVLLAVNAAAALVNIWSFRQFKVRARDECPVIRSSVRGTALTSDI